MRHDGEEYRSRFNQLDRIEVGIEIGKQGGGGVRIQAGAMVGFCHETEIYTYVGVTRLDCLRGLTKVAWWILAIVIGVLVALMTLHHEEIVNVRRK